MVTGITVTIGDPPDTTRPVEGNVTVIESGVEVPCQVPVDWSETKNRLPDDVVLTALFEEVVIIVSVPTPTAVCDPASISVAGLNTPSPLSLYTETFARSDELTVAGATLLTCTVTEFSVVPPAGCVRPTLKIPSGALFAFKR